MLAGRPSPPGLGRRRGSRVRHSTAGLCPKLPLCVKKHSEFQESKSLRGYAVVCNFGSGVRHFYQLRCGGLAAVPSSRAARLRSSSGACSGARGGFCRVRSLHVGGYTVGVLCCSPCGEARRATWNQSSLCRLGSSSCCAEKQTQGAWGRLVSVRSGPNHIEQSDPGAWGAGCAGAGLAHVALAA